MRCLSIDWLTIYGRHDRSINIQKCLPMYDVRLNDRGTNMFNEWYSVYTHDGYLVAQICRSPFSLKESGGIFYIDSMTIQMSNRMCYDVRLLDTLDMISSKLRFKPQSITRIDIAYDFNLFDNGMKPKTLINGFHSAKYLKKGYSKAFTIGTQYTDYNPEYMSFKGKGSAISVKLYDKSKEMEEVKSKPYIQDQWLACGLDRENVWRLEFSIMSGGCDYVKIDTGEYIKLSIGMLSNRLLLWELFCGLMESRFQFRKAVQGKRMSDLEKVRLIKAENCELLKPIKVTKSKDLDRRVKIIKNAMLSVIDNENMSNDEKYTMLDALNIIAKRYRVFD